MLEKTLDELVKQVEDLRENDLAPEEMGVLAAMIIAHALDQISVGDVGPAIANVADAIGRHS